MQWGKVYCAIRDVRSKHNGDGAIIEVNTISQGLPCHHTYNYCWEWLYCLHRCQNGEVKVTVLSKDDA
jgi:hypothetical protein